LALYFKFKIVNLLLFGIRAYTFKCFNFILLIYIGTIITYKFIPQHKN